MCENKGITIFFNKGLTKKCYNEWKMNTFPCTSRGSYRYKRRIRYNSWMKGHRAWKEETTKFELWIDTSKQDTPNRFRKPEDGHWKIDTTIWRRTTKEEMFEERRLNQNIHVCITVYESEQAPYNKGNDIFLISTIRVLYNIASYYLSSICVITYIQRHFTAIKQTQFRYLPSLKVLELIYRVLKLNLFLHIITIYWPFISFFPQKPS